MTPELTPSGQLVYTSHEYFEKHKDNVQEFVAVTMIRAIKAGEIFIRKVGPLIVKNRAPADGYAAMTPFDGDDRDGFLTAQDLVEKTYDVFASNAPLVTPLEDLPEDVTVVPVAKNDQVKRGEQVYAAGVDGVLVTFPGTQPTFYWNAELSSVFNYAGARKMTAEQYFVVYQDNAPLPGIVVEEQVRIKLGGQTHIAPVGSVLMKLADDSLSKGDHGLLMPRFARCALRREPDSFIVPRLAAPTQS